MMKDPEFFVYYDRANTRPRKHFGRDGRAAMDWATTHVEQRPEVIKCQSVWSWQDAQPDTRSDSSYLVETGDGKVTTVEASSADEAKSIMIVLTGERVMGVTRLNDDGTPAFLS